MSTREIVFELDDAEGQRIAMAIVATLNRVEPDDVPPTALYLAGRAETTERRALAVLLDMRERGIVGSFWQGRAWTLIVPAAKVRITCRGAS